MRTLNLVAENTSINEMFHHFVSKTPYSLSGISYGNDTSKIKHSFFHFHIEESIADLFNNMKSGAKEERWDIKDEDEGDGKIKLSDPDCFSYAHLTQIGEWLYIQTAWSGFVYGIYPTEGGCEVFFWGGLNALLRQNLLPAMTYTPHTLEAKYEDMEDFISIAEYCKIREESRKGKKNEQDQYGFLINKSFNNEVPSLPLWTDKVVEEEFEITEVAPATYSLGDVMSSLANKL